MVMLHTDFNLPYGLCICGCERKTSLSSRTVLKAGRVKGRPNPYIRGHYHHINLQPTLCACGCGSAILPRRNSRTKQLVKYRRGHNKQLQPLPEERFWSKVERTDTCWIWTASATEYGYGRISWEVDGKKRLFRAHQVSWMLHYGTIPFSLSVLHKCDNPPCVRPDHLFLGTQLDNMRDMVFKGRGHKRGGAHYAST